MKTLNDYMAMPYRMEIVEDKDEGGFVVSYPDLPGCITCGETVESAAANALDAKKAWMEAALEDGVEIHEPDSLENYSGIGATIPGKPFDFIFVHQTPFFSLFKWLYASLPVYSNDLT